MKEVYLIYEENHGVVGVAKNYASVCACLTVDKWLTLEEVAETLKKGRENFEENLEKFGIILEKKTLW
jgi:hypothetical protein